MDELLNFEFLYWNFNKILIFGFFRKIGVHSWYCLKAINEHQSDLIFKRMVQELLNFDLFSSLEIP
jgi:hypothetical protein